MPLNYIYQPEVSNHSDKYQDTPLGGILISGEIQYGAKKKLHHLVNQCE